MNITIFVEGKEDKEFVEVYLKHLGDLKAEIVVCGGNAINMNIRSSIKEAKDKGKRVLVVFDSDNHHKSTYERLIKESEGLLDEIFLFPDNSNNGELETLLFSVAKKSWVCECFKRYKNCIASHNPDYVKNIRKKSARYAYFEALGLLDEKKRKEAYPNIFDFTSPNLDALKNFLCKNFGVDK